MIPVLFPTTIAIPVSIKGTVKSTTASLSELIIKDVITISVFRFTKSAIRPFHFPFYKVIHIFNCYFYSKSYRKLISCQLFLQTRRITEYFILHRGRFYRGFVEHFYPASLPPKCPIYHPQL